MTPPTAPLQFLQAFRQKLLRVFPMRADALFELVDALLLTVDPRSPVELSASPAFRRRFSMVYDAPRQGKIHPALYAPPPPVELDPLTGKRRKKGRPTLHGAKFRLAAPPPPERQATFPLLTATVRVSAWGTLHFKTLPALVGRLLRVALL